MSLSSANPTHLRPDPGDPTCNQLVDREMACLPQASLTEALLDFQAQPESLSAPGRKIAKFYPDIFTRKLF